MGILFTLENQYSKITTFQVNSSNLYETDITFELSDFELLNVSEQNTTYTKIICPGSSEFAQPGKPDLPRFTSLIAIPETGSINFRITDSEEQIISDLEIFPRQPLQNESTRDSFDFLIDNQFYTEGSIFPIQQVVIGEPVILRDLRIVSLTINPFRYDPLTREMHIIKNARIVIESNTFPGINEITSTQKKSPAFEPLYKSVILNYEEVRNRNEEYQDPSYLFIYPNSTQVEQYLQDLVDWKHQKGFIVNAVNTAETGSTSYQIRNFISNAYENWENPPEFVCLVGDAGGSFNIPTGSINGGEGDHFYTMLAGDDILSDIFLGRLSFNSIFEFQTILNKIFNYEKTPFADFTSWYDSALLVGDPNDSGPSVIDTKRHIGDMIGHFAENITCTEVYSGSYSSQMTTNLNAGVSYFNYRGFAGMSGWTVSHINNLNNGFMLPVAVSLTCNTGNFEGTYDCISEAFLKAGSPSLPKGAIAAVSTATGQTHTCFNNCMDAGIFYGLFADSIHHMGGALNRGKLNMYLNYPDNPNDQVLYFSYWNNLMGDPGLELWTAVPQDLNVICETEIALGSNFLEVTVENEFEEPLNNARVTILKGDDEIFETGLTDYSGNILLPLNAGETGEINLTVTKHNYIPHLGTINIIQQQQFVNVSEIIIDDDNSGSSSGNGDGLINPGEDIELAILLENSGYSDLSGISATLYSNSELIVLNDNFVEYGDIAAGMSAASPDAFDLHISETAIGGSTFLLDLIISDQDRNQWHDIIPLQIAGVILTPLSYEVFDSGNNIIEPGETGQISFSISNLGSIPAEEIYGTLSCDNYHIDILDDQGYFGVILPEEIVSNNTDRFELTVSTHVLAGTQIPLQLQLYNSLGFSQTIFFQLEIGEVTVNDPLGPDTFGYYCYDDEDNSINAPLYNWIEISPALGGPGTEIVMNDYGDMGDVHNIDLPFILRFYDEDYSTASISSNGWICPGFTQNESFMNWSIPGPLGPSPLIAPFWDDLIATSGDVSYYYDQSNHLFIIEWNNLQNQYNYAEETFQVIIYDNVYYPTSNHNNELLFQYKVVNNVDQGQYSGFWFEHGQFATVGLEDHTASVGLEYTFDNSYPTAAKPLENETALRFTGPPIYQDEPYLQIGGLTIVDENENGAIEYGESVDLFISLNNLGNNSANDVSAVLNIEDEYIAVINNTASYQEVPGGGQTQNQTPFSFQVANNSPNGHIVQADLLVTSAENDWELHFTLILQAPQIVYSSQLINDGNNNILDPGETTDVIVSLENIGDAAAYNGLIHISTTDENIMINDNDFEVSLFNPGASLSAIFNVTAADSAEIGHLCEIDWRINCDQDYMEEGEFNIVIALIPVYLEEHFELFPPTGWSTSPNSNWSQGSWNQAGGTAPEAQFDWYPQNTGDQRLISLPVSTLGSFSLELEFKHSVSHFSGNYDLHIQTSSDGVNWTNAHTFPAGNISPTTENITLSTADVGTEDFQFAFCFSGNSYNINNWWIDDVILTNTESSPFGYLAGNVTLTGGSGALDQVAITAGDFTIHPDNEGEYTLPLPAGIYDVHAQLAGYGTIYEYNVVIEQLLISTLNFDLQYLTPPSDLQAEVIENDVNLAWEISQFLPEQKIESTKVTQVSKNTNDDRTRDLTGFNIYRDEEIIYEIVDPEELYYIDRQLPNGEYCYYITALYEEEESEPSNQETVVIDFNQLEENQIPLQTELTGNYPNPFNPSTIISYQLSENCLVKLEIFNLKGQCVKTLINNNTAAGCYDVEWDGTDNNQIPVTSGIYFYKLEAGEIYSVKKMLLLK
ncbi:MAG: hypothetical protein APR54_10820 [Candidatus Cloacimonas sp. SDB]|nr:MAG: hypothetical protein APR54_10820 [Candidatus Cloacimonas sp. SDB]